jgi:predicted Zn-dependent peptidase
MKIRHFTPLLIILFLNPILLSQERFRKYPPNPDPLPSLKLPEIESQTLSNGLKISLMRLTKIPVISLQLIIFSGESTSPDSLPGLATFTSKMLNRGSLNLSFSEIEKTIDLIGGEFSVKTFPDYTVFSLFFLEEYFDTALELLSQMLLQPTFPRQEIDTYRKIFFNDDIIKKYSLKNIQMFFNKFYCPNNAHLVLVGNLSLSTASRKISSYLYTWRKQNIETYYFPPPKPLEKTKICFINIPGLKDALIFSGSSLLPKTDPEYFSLIVLNQVLGGTPMSRLFMNLRESKGFAYWAFSEMEFYKSCGIFYIRARVRPDVIHSSVLESLNEIRKISAQRIPGQEIEQAKSYLIGNFPLAIQRYDELASRVSEIKALNLNEGHWNKYYENIMYIDSQIVFKSAYNNLLYPPIIVIVGDQDNIIDELLKFKTVEVYDNSGKYLYQLTKEQ